ATIVRELSRRATVRPDDYPELRVAILPTEFAKAERAIRELLQSDVPDVLLALGVAPRAQGVRLERTARNRDDAALADNAGEQRTLGMTERRIVWRISFDRAGGGVRGDGRR